MEGVLWLCLWSLSLPAASRRPTAPAPALASATDEDLMVAYRDGDVAAFEVLLERHRRGVFRFLYRSVGDERQAEDLLQEVFLRVIQGAASYRPSARFTTWVYTIARNILIDEARKARHRRTVSLDAPVGGGGNAGEGEGPTYASILPSTEAAADALAMDGQFRERLLAALGRLPEEQRTVFLLREAEGLGFAEIGRVVGCPENTAKSRMRYALEALRQHLADLWTARMAMVGEPKSAGVQAGAGGEGGGGAGDPLAPGRR